MENQQNFYEIRINTFTKQLNLSDIFGNTNQFWLEIGFGVGKFFIQMVKSFPSINFVGIENDRFRHSKMCSKLSKRNLTNARVLCVEASLAVRYLFSPETFDAVFINFPDPWPKDKHEKNRLLTPDFVYALARLMKLSAMVRIITDVLPYSEHINSVIMESCLFARTDIFYPEIDFPTTTFQDRFVEEKVPFYPFIYKKIKQ